MRIKSNIIILISSLLLCGISCKNKNEDSTAVEETSNENPAIIVTKKQFDSSKMENGKIEKRTFSDEIRVSGNIEVPNKGYTIINSLVEGTIGSISLHEGQYVTKGQKLYTVTNPILIDIQQEYLVLKAKQPLLLEANQRLSALAKENLATASEILSGQIEYQTMVTNINSIRQKLRLYGISAEQLTIDNLSPSVSVKAPVNGYIAKIGAKQGAFIGPNTEVVTIVEKNNLILVLEILQKDIRHLNVGDQVNFTCESFDTKVFKAIIKSINPMVNDNGTISAYAVPTSNDKFIGGTHATAIIRTSPHTSSAVPVDAVVTIDNESYILLLQSSENDNFTYKPLKVRTGNTSNGYKEIKFDSQEQVGTEILIKGAYYLTQ